MQGFFSTSCVFLGGSSTTPTSAGLPGAHLRPHPVNARAILPGARAKTSNFPGHRRHIRHTALPLALLPPAVAWYRSRQQEQQQQFQLPQRHHQRQLAGSPRPSHPLLGAAVLVWSSSRRHSTVSVSHVRRSVSKLDDRCLRLPFSSASSDSPISRPLSCSVILGHGVR